MNIGPGAKRQAFSFGMLLLMGMNNFHIKVYGDVQGVFYRDSAGKKAEELDIKGFARNEADGSVYIEAEGEKENLEKFLKWCEEGSKYASVREVEVEEGEMKNYNKFEIRY